MEHTLLQIGNAKSQITNLRPELFKLLSYELSYKIGQEGTRRILQRNGSVKILYWDGFKRLMTPKGFFPSGLIPRVLRLLKKWGVSPEIHDLRERPIEGVPLWKIPNNFEFRDYQLFAIDAAEKIGRGVIDSPPRSGKTIMIAELVRRVSSKTVITSPTEAIARQTMDRLLSMFADNDWFGMQNRAYDFYLLTGGTPKTQEQQIAAKRATVFVATVNTAVLMPQEWWDDVLCLIVDERHHQAAKIYHKLNNLAVNAYWRWGFTGTNYRSNPGEQIALECCLGRIIASYSIEEMTKRKVLVPGEVEFCPVDFDGMRSLKFLPAYSRGIVNCDLRNRLIAHAAKQLIEEERKTLILVHQVKHGKILNRLISKSKFVEAADGLEVRKAIDRLNSGKLFCLIGSPVVGEGLDCPAADALIYAKGYKARVTHTQDTFRVLTGLKGKKFAKIIDFADRHNRVLLDHSVERMKNYIGMGLSVKIREMSVDKKSLI